jgi:hypothetical protein
MGFPAFVLILVFGFAFGVGGLAIILEHFQKLAKIKAETHSVGNAEIAQALDSVRREIAELRETTTRYDLSFDSALQRLEGRVANIEQSSRQSSSDSPQTAALRQGGL